MQDAVVDELALVGRGFFEHPVDDFGFDAGVADANAQAPVVG
ncbi:hypothetical protein SDC9_122353 [bioreactor metagenome]|uniref:Uncharacterized protein n=1 Tax=bioreactor metagenome TaxID=1076179 RepID=A0A645CEJ2_9ZZZZ